MQITDLCKEITNLRKYVDELHKRATATQEGMHNVFQFAKDNINRLDTKLCEIEEVVDELDAASDISGLHSESGELQWVISTPSHAGFVITDDGYVTIDRPWEELRLLLT